MLTQTHAHTHTHTHTKFYVLFKLKSHELAVLSSDIRRESTISVEFCRYEPRVEAGFELVCGIKQNSNRLTSDVVVAAAAAAVSVSVVDARRTSLD